MFDGLLGIVGNIHRGSHFCYFPPEYRVWFLGAVNLFISRLPWSCHGLVLGFVRHMYFTWYLGHDLSRISSESWGFSTIHSGWVWISLPDAVQALKSWLSCSLLDLPGAAFRTSQFRSHSQGLQGFLHRFLRLTPLQLTFLWYPVPQTPCLISP